MCGMCIPSTEYVVYELCVLDREVCLLSAFVNTTPCANTLLVSTHSWLAHTPG